MKKIATFNANSIRSREGIILDWMRRHDPDILCIQETKVQDQDFPMAPYEDAGYHVSFRGQKAYNGVAIISKDIPDSVQCGFLDAGPVDDTRLMHASFGPLHIVNTYVPQGREVDHEMFQYKLRWFERLTNYFTQGFEKDDLLLWTGDMNVARTPDDVHNPSERELHVCFHADARKAFESCIAWGFEDVLRKHHPEPGQFTFFDYRTPNAAKRGLGWRIDYIFTTPALTEKCTDAVIDVEPRLLEKPSDHTFLVAEFDL
ncbi:MAG: exodeoxyribonuclease III [Verrucomicrobia bacterium]|nr:exodeoxyribonuclease III [Verrucomicrobiota bacterium]